MADARPRRRAAFLALAALLLFLPARAAETLPDWLQGEWHGRSCVVDGLLGNMPPTVRAALDRAITGAVLVVGPSGYIQTGSNLTHLVEAWDVTAVPTARPVQDVLAVLHIERPMVFGAPVPIDPDQELTGVVLTIGRCGVLPARRIALPGEPPPPDSATASTDCHPVSVFRFPDQSHVAVPSDGPIRCLQVFERRSAGVG